MSEYKITIKDIYKEIHNIEDRIDNKEDKELRKSIKWERKK